MPATDTPTHCSPEYHHGAMTTRVCERLQDQLVDNHLRLRGSKVGRSSGTSGASPSDSLEEGGAVLGEEQLSSQGRQGEGGTARRKDEGGTVMKYQTPRLHAITHFSPFASTFRPKLRNCSGIVKSGPDPQNIGPPHEVVQTSGTIQIAGKQVLV